MNKEKFDSFNNFNSHLIINNNILYDGELDINVKSVFNNFNNKFGIAFRYKDEYNYYSISIKNHNEFFL